MQVIEAKRNQGASSEVVRDINRRIVLNLIRTRQPISRADLARASACSAAPSPSSSNN